GHPVEGLLTVHRDIVPHRLQRLAWKGLVNAFGLLQAQHVGLSLREPSGQVVHSLLDGVDVPGCDAHGGFDRCSIARAQLLCCDSYAVFTAARLSSRMRERRGYVRRPSSHTKK